MDWAVPVLLAQRAGFHPLPDWVPLQAPGFLLRSVLVLPALTLGPATCLSLGSVHPTLISVLLLYVSPWKGLGDRGGGKGRAGEVSWGWSSEKPTLDGVWLCFSLGAVEGVGAAGSGHRHSTVSSCGGAPARESESLAGELL